MTSDDGILRRQSWWMRERKVGWLPYLPSLALAPCLVAALGRGFEELYIVGGWDAAHTPPHEWFKAPASERWQVTYRPGNKHSMRTGEYERSGKKVTVRMSAAWFDGYDNVPQSAMDDLRTLLHRHIDIRANPMGTPARTGQELLAHLLPEGRNYLPSPLDVQDLMRKSHSALGSQGHRECVAQPDLESVRSVAVYDARWMYASCVRHLPVILANAGLRYDTEPETAGPYVPGFYRIIFRVPQGWAYPGLLAYRDDTSGVVSFPNTGKDAYETWVTEPELRLALENRWRVHIMERILYAHQSAPGADPTREWITRLRTMREVAPTEPVRAAIRHLCLDSIGSWARRARTEWHVIPGDEEEKFPPDALRINPIYVYDRRTGEPIKRVCTEWSRVVPLAPESLPFVRPEWSAMVWGRARAKLHAYMLNFPPRSLLWLRDDAIAIDPTAEDLPTASLEDPETPGSFRVKKSKTWKSAAAVPRDETTWRALMDETAEEDDEEGEIDGPQED